MSTGRSAVTVPVASHHVCPWWMGYLLLLPIRRLLESPERMLEPHVRPGMRILDFGASMGFFSLPAARLAGPQGRVTSVDLSERALRVLQRRARRAHLDDRILTVTAGGEPDWAQERRESFDLAMAIHVIHELPDIPSGLLAIASTLRPGGKLLLAEPPGHISRAVFDAEVDQARAVGLRLLAPPAPGRALVALFAKADQATSVAAVDGRDAA